MSCVRLYILQFNVLFNNNKVDVSPENYARQVRTLEGFRFQWFVTYVSTSYWSLSIGKLFYKQLVIFVPWSLDDPHSNTAKPIFVWLNKLLNVTAGIGCHLAEGDVSLSWACIWSSLHSSVPSKRCLWLSTADFKLVPYLSVWDERCVRNKLQTLCLPSQINTAA